MHTHYTRTANKYKNEQTLYTHKLYIQKYTNIIHAQPINTKIHKHYTRTTNKYKNTQTLYTHNQ